MAIANNAAMEKERDTLQEECEVIMELTRKMVQDNARSGKDQADYKVKYGSLSGRYEKASMRLAEVNKDIVAHNAKRNELEGFLKLLDGRDELLIEFDENLWLGLGHQMKVDTDGGFKLVLKDGCEVMWATSKR